MIVDFNGKSLVFMHLYIFEIFIGNINDDLIFEYGEGATASNGCGTTLMGEFWYFGSGKKVSFFHNCII